MGGPSIWVVDLGYAPTHWKDTGWIPPQGGLQVDGEEYKYKDVWDVGLPPTVRGNGGGGGRFDFRGDGGGDGGGNGGPIGGGYLRSPPL